jgi:redox-sensitive bicupin YhaK (pirin superfamily)
VVSGELAVAEQAVPKWRLVELTDGDEVEVASASGARLLFGHAEPIDEPVFSHGPFVMTTREEIIAAIQDYNAGKFGSLNL